jgi:hypothetical protein
LTGPDRTGPDRTGPDRTRPDGQATLSGHLDELRRWSTAIGGRYMGAERAEEFGVRNGVPGELLVRLRITKVVAQSDVAA